MTRAQIEDAYTVEDGIIQTPGKFESEPVYAVYFHDHIMNGHGEPVGDEDDNTVKFTIEPEDLVEFPELNGIKHVYVSEDEQGFVWCTVTDE